MVSFKSTVLALGLAGAASAFVGSISVPPTLKVTDDSTIPVTLVPGHSGGTLDSLSLVVGLHTASDYTSGNIGRQILRIFNLKHLGLSELGSNHTVEVKLTKEDLAPFGTQPGSYIVTGTTLNAAGAQYAPGVAISTAHVQLQL